MFYSGQPDVHQLLASVLGDLTFPASRWQLVTVAELWGADEATRQELTELPNVEYLGLDHVTREVLAARARAEHAEALRTQRLAAQLAVTLHPETAEDRERGQRATPHLTTRDFFARARSRPSSTKGTGVGAA